MRFPSPSGDVVKLEHLVKPSCIKEVRFPKRTGEDAELRSASHRGVEEAVRPVETPQRDTHVLSTS